MSLNGKPRVYTFTLYATNVLGILKRMKTIPDILTSHYGNSKNDGAPQVPAAVDETAVTTSLAEKPAALEGSRGLAVFVLPSSERPASSPMVRAFRPGWSPMHAMHARGQKTRVRGIPRTHKISSPSVGESTRCLSS